MNELDLDISWRIGEKSFSKIVQKLLSLHPTTIVEFGSGASSIRLAQKFEHSKIVAIDHDKDFFSRLPF